jgi:hypothetical protein
MMAPRNIPAALATAAAAMADAPKTAIGLRAALARCRLRNPADLAPFTDDEAREIFEAALSREPLPAGAVGEAVLAYLVALRREVNPVPFAVSALQRFEADDDAGFQALGAWLHGAAERAAARADALRAELDRRALQ